MAGCVCTRYQCNAGDEPYQRPRYGQVDQDSTNGKRAFALLPERVEPAIVHPKKIGPFHGSCVEGAERCNCRQQGENQ
jgi:hypothetical protein